MGKPTYRQSTDQQISAREECLQIGQVIFRSIDCVTWQWPDLTEVSGNDSQVQYILLADLQTDQLLDELKSAQRRFPNHSLISKCLGLAYLNHAESVIFTDTATAHSLLNNAVDALERVLEHNHNDPEIKMALLLAYCYLEDLETEEQGADYAEFIHQLLYNTAESLLPLMATACEQRGRDFFQKQLFTLGFTFLKQALFIQRQRNLIDAENKDIRKRMLATGTVLISLTSAVGWKNIALQIRDQVAGWYAESKPDNQ